MYFCVCIVQCISQIQAFPEIQAVSLASLAISLPQYKFINYKVIFLHSESFIFIDYGNAPLPVQ